MSVKKILTWFVVFVWTPAALSAVAAELFVLVTSPRTADPQSGHVYPVRLVSRTGIYAYDIYVTHTGLLVYVGGWLFLMLMVVMLMAVGLLLKTRRKPANTL
ncbi:hypothetical protein [Acidocella sp.]|uniref:hypothetical protein n=1 Tax=Acidocella sp. TaxID=50710 RepID=UPI00261B441E|nr:hypothetical protein [Acidocella sp.]